jgi:RNA polymerase sigma factor (sigma-70 family)
MKRTPAASGRLTLLTEHPAQIIPKTKCAAILLNSTRSRPAVMSAPAPVQMSCSNSSRASKLSAMPRVEDAIIKNLQVFVAFARKRLADRDLAEDVVQDSLIKALSADRHPDTDEETTAWFYRILRRSIIDLYRKQGARARALERFEKELPHTPDEEAEHELCKCFRRLLQLVPEHYRDLLEEIDLTGKNPDEVAAAMGVTRNNLTVKLHRARKHLRKALSQNCRACSAHGCLDCTCEDSSGDASCH